jgi:hypothetical protein
MHMVTYLLSGSDTLNSLKTPSSVGWTLLYSYAATRGSVAAMACFTMLGDGEDIVLARSASYGTSDRS